MYVAHVATKSHKDARSLCYHLAMLESGDHASAGTILIWEACTTTLSDGDNWAQTVADAHI